MLQATTTRQATNATANNMAQKPSTVNKKPLALKTIFNPWKMILVTKGAMDQKGGAATVTTTGTPIKLRCCIKWWNQVTGKKQPKMSINKGSWQSSNNCGKQTQQSHSIAFIQWIGIPLTNCAPHYKENTSSYHQTWQ